MDVPGQPAGRTTRSALLSLAAGAAALGLAACGTQVADTSATASKASVDATQRAGQAVTAPASLPSSVNPGGPMIPAPGTGALCTAVPAVTRLVVSPVSALPRSHVNPAMVAGVTVRSAAQARAVAKALCALPPMPSAPVGCPADLGAGYRLSFAAGRTVFPVVTAEASGCREVAGAVRPRARRHEVLGRAPPGRPRPLSPVRARVVGCDPPGGPNSPRRSARGGRVTWPPDRPSAEG